MKDESGRTPEPDRTPEADRPSGADPAEPRQAPPPRPTMGQRIRHWLVGAAALIALLLVVQNQEPVNTNFLFWNAEMPRFLLLVLVYLLGTATGWILRWRSGK